MQCLAVGSCRPTAARLSDFAVISGAAGDTDTRATEESKDGALWLSRRHDCAADVAPAVSNLVLLKDTPG